MSVYAISPMAMTQWLRFNMKTQNKIKNKLEHYLENECCFRDYQIRNSSEFGVYSKIAVHQRVHLKSLERYVDMAIDKFLKHGFSNIVFYIRGSK